jgi:hypothetical protein
LDSAKVIARAACEPKPQPPFSHGQCPGSRRHDIFQMGFLLGQDGPRSVFLEEQLVARASAHHHLVFRFHDRLHDDERHLWPEGLGCVSVHSVELISVDAGSKLLSL